MTQRRQLRAAIVGAGLMGRWHADAIRRSGGLVSAVVDVSLDRASALAARYQAEPSESLQTVLNQVDVVHICTPTSSHEALAALVIDAGRHALVEKPLAASAAATRSLVARAAARSVLLCPVHQFCWQPGAQRLFAALPTLGVIRHVDFTACSAGASFSGAAPDDVAFEVLPHPLSLLARIDALALTRQWTVQHPAPGELRLTAVCGSATLSVVISMSGRPTLNALRVVAEHGTAHVDLFHGFSVLERGAVSRWRKIVQPFWLAGASGAAATANLIARAGRREPAYPGLRTLVSEFYDAVAGSGAPPVTAEETVAIAEVLERVRAASGLVPVAATR